jgi:hypothetical protein
MLSIFYWKLLAHGRTRRVREERGEGGKKWGGYEGVEVESVIRVSREREGRVEEGKSGKWWGGVAGRKVVEWEIGAGINISYFAVAGLLIAYIERIYRTVHSRLYSFTCLQWNSGILTSFPVTSVAIVY